MVTAISSGSSGSIIGSHKVLVIVFKRAHIVHNALEALLAEWALSFHFGPLQEAGETEGVKAAVRERLVLRSAQTDGTAVVRRIRAPA